MRDGIGYFPARALQPVERAVVAEWLANAGDVAAAYVSNRRSDDPAHYRRIVIVTKPDDGPSHLIHAPAKHSIWVLFSLSPETEFRTFPSSARCIELRPTRFEGRPQKCVSEEEKSSVRQGGQLLKPTRG